MNPLAIHGGSPVRTRPFPTSMLGAAWIGAEELRELQDVVSEQSPFRHYGIGHPQKANRFEQEAREMLGAKYALALSSGTAALSCALVALDISVGDEVILPAFGWFSDYNTIVSTGALPVFAEIDDSLNLCPDDLARKITPRTKAVIVIHYQGAAARMEEIVTIAGARGIKVIEDCAQSFGGLYRGKPLGTLGDIGIASFQGNKVITCGEGGLLYTNNEHYFVRAVRYHDLGFVRACFADQLDDKALASADEAFAGLQFRMGELQAAFVLAQLRKLPDLLRKCRSAHQKIKKRFRNSEHISFRPSDEGECGISAFLKFESPETAKQFKKALSAEGIPIGPSSSCTNLLGRAPVRTKRMPRDTLPPFGPGFAGEHAVYDSAVCPETDRILGTYVCVAIGAMYSDEDIADIIAAIAKVEEGLYGNCATE